MGTRSLNNTSDVGRSLRKRLEKYIEKDQWKKIAKLVGEGVVAIDSIVGKRGEKMLHLAVREESVNCLEWLLEHGANPGLVDRKGNLALHLAVEAVISEYSRTRERDLVSTLLTYSMGLLSCRNKAGFTPR